MHRKTRIHFILLCATLVCTACGPTLAAGPASMQSGGQEALPTEEAVRGQSGPKTGEPTPVPGLPAKDKGEALPPINEEGGDKRAPEDVKLLEPGALYEEGVENAKAPPGRIEGREGEGPKEALPATPEVRRYGRIQFKMTADEVTAERILTLEGALLPSTTIDGEFIYIVTADGKPLHVGSFRDPLLAVGLPQEPEQGYSAIEMSEGFFHIAIPGHLLEERILASLVFEFYRLDPSVPYTTPLTLDTVPRLIRRSTPFAQVSGKLLVEILEKSP